MKKQLLMLVVVMASTIVAFGQTNVAQKLLTGDNALTIGGYGEVHYNQSIDEGTIRNGKLDVHRMVMLFGYRFNDRLRFVTELEFEHVKEVYVEQAFLQYQLTEGLNLRAGLLLIPMGYVNEYHEPVNFLSVERPLVDKYIVPSTWREIGLGISGNLLQANLKYQLYVVGGPKGYDGSWKLKGSSGIRKGRQKGAEAIINSPGVTGKVSFYGIKNLNLALAGYAGYSQSTLYNKLDREDDLAVKTADSSRVFITMTGFDARYRNNAFRVNSQIYYMGLSNTIAYNNFGADDKANDLGESMLGGYLELAYDVLSFGKTAHKLFPFVRFEYLNTHFTTAGDLAKNPAYEQKIITTGLAWKLDKGVVVKSDVQWKKKSSDEKASLGVNAGIGVMF